MVPRHRTCLKLLMYGASLALGACGGEASRTPPLPFRLHFEVGERRAYDTTVEESSTSKASKVSMESRETRVTGWVLEIDRVETDGTAHGRVTFDRYREDGSIRSNLMEPSEFTFDSTTMKPEALAQRKPTLAGLLGTTQRVTITPEGLVSEDAPPADSTEAWRFVQNVLPEDRLWAVLYLPSKRVEPGDSWGYGSEGAAVTWTFDRSEGHVAFLRSSGLMGSEGTRDPLRAGPAGRTLQGATVTSQLEVDERSGWLVRGVHSMDAGQVRRDGVDEMVTRVHVQTTWTARPAPPAK